MKRPYQLLTLFIVIPIMTPLLTGCGVSRSYSINYDRPCGCHGSSHHHRCSYGYSKNYYWIDSHKYYYHDKHHDKKSDHRPDPRPDPHYTTHRAPSAAIANLNHRPIQSRSVNPRPTFKPKTNPTPPRTTRQVSKPAPNRSTGASRPKSRSTKATKTKERVKRRP